MSTPTITIGRWRVRLWQGFTGVWFWQIVDAPTPYVVDGSAPTREAARAAARTWLEQAGWLRRR